MKDGHAEAVKYALRQSKDGVIVSFVIHPNETNGLLSLPVGARLMLAWAEIEDDETPAASSNGKTSDFESENVGSTPTAAATEHNEALNRAMRPKRERSLAEQCGVTCADVRFQEFMGLRFSETKRPYSQTETISFVRGLCGVKSRSELRHNHDAANKWRKLHSDYQNYLTSKAYEGSVR